eukprot:m.1020956 g.1020956  ORF g.1020956 m.1020956 type:complete len:498 (+) comp24094_c0_seq6:484-1977(+)
MGRLHILASLAGISFVLGVFVNDSMLPGQSSRGVPDKVNVQHMRKEVVAEVSSTRFSVYGDVPPQSQSQDIYCAASCCCLLREMIFEPSARMSVNASALEYLRTDYNCASTNTTSTSTQKQSTESCPLLATAFTASVLQGSNTPTNEAVPTPIVVTQTSYRKPVVAIFVSGVLRRFLPARLNVGVIQPIRARGFDVHVYIHLINANVSTFQGNISSFGLEPPLDTIYPDLRAYRRYVTRVFKGIYNKPRGSTAHFGACEMKQFDISSEQEDIDPFPVHDGSKMAAIKEHFQAYPPWDASSEESRNLAEIGKNVLRRYSTVRQQWRMAVAQEQQSEQGNTGASARFKYEWILWIREDISWLLPLDLRWSTFPTGLHTSGVVYTRGCVMFRNMSDKVLLMDRTGASTLLPRLYPDFYNNTALGGGRNAETYVTEVMKYYGIKHVVARTDVIAAADARYELLPDSDVSRMCYRKKYFCSDFGDQTRLVFANISKPRCRYR